MKILTFFFDGAYRLGIQTTEGVIDVSAANRVVGAAGLFETPQSFYQQGLAALPLLDQFVKTVMADERRASWLLDEQQLTLGPCLPQPGKIICIGLNYRNHAKEAGFAIPDVPVLFSKFQNAVTAPDTEVPLPSVAKKYDYEAELAVVIGKTCRSVREEDALDYVLGYCNANDVSARDLQNLTSQWLLGKTLDKFLPLGPYLLTADEAADPQNWPVRCWLNDELRQDSNTSDMIFTVAQLISFISSHFTLQPGDLISTGTPQGVILGLPKPRTWMKPGDRMSIEVGPLGKLTNTLVAGS